jgi:hypothetical protein
MSQAVFPVVMYIHNFVSIMRATCPAISAVAGNSMDTRPATFMDGYTNFMESKSGEFCGGDVPRLIMD